MIRLLLWKQSDLGLPCLSRAFWQASSVQNFRTFTVKYLNYKPIVISSTVLMALSLYIKFCYALVLF